MSVRTPVLIAGGGPAGLTAAILLQRFGIDFMLIDRKPGTADHPRAGFHNVRTMELFRQWGIEEEIRANGFPIETQNRLFWSTRLFGGFELGEIAPNEDLGFQQIAAAASPTSPGFCSQDKCEPIMRELAGRGGGQLRFSTRLEHIHPGEDSVVAEVLDLASGEAYSIEADYVLAVDGSNSLIARELGLEYPGSVVLGQCFNIQFVAEGVRARLQDRLGFMYTIINPEVSGIWGTLDRTDRWVLNFGVPSGERARKEDYPDERCIEIVRAAAGDPDLDVRILTINPWTMRAQLAATLKLGRVLFAGDSAHQLPPTGGFGMNTAVQDVHNLIWKLAGVLRGWADPSLLDTYDVERKAVAHANLQQAMATAFRQMEAGMALHLRGDEIKSIEEPVSGEPLRTEITRKIPTLRDEFITLGQALGFSYESAIVCDDGTEPVAVENPIRDFVPSARPGSRAPHAWLLDQGQRISTLDLFDTTFVLLTGPDGAPWKAAALMAADALAMPMRAFAIGPTGELVDPDGSWCALYGIAADGAVLVRPDGHVAWRSHAMAGDPARIMHEVLTKVSCRTTHELQLHG